MIRVESPDDQVRVAKVYEAGQEHLFQYWDELSPDERTSLLAQLGTFDLTELHRLYDSLVADGGDAHTPLGNLVPPEMISLPDDPAADDAWSQAAARGWQALRDGEVGVFLVAGGQGTRLRFDGPKGMYPVGPVSERSLFQLFAERILAFRRQIKRALPWFIMTSEENDAATKQFFKDNSNFQLNSSEIVFHKQGMLPVVDKRGKILMSSKSEIIRSPDGHGSTVRVIRELREELEKRGVRYLFYMQVDNPMIEILDPAFIGHHILKGSQFSSKAISKIEPEEKLGVFCRRGNKLGVVEYSELSQEQSELRDPDGKLSFRAGNLANHVLSVDFLCPAEGETSFEMPYHVARKATPHMRNGELVDASQPNSIKFESFLFDAIPYAQNPIVVETSRREYAPIKNLEGDCSPATSRRALIEEYAGWLGNAGVEIPRNANGEVDGEIEISPLFASSALQLKDRLNGEKIEFQNPLVLE